jgi:uncharacterized membrane protein YraQ (UPF0718 family)
MKKNYIIFNILAVLAYFYGVLLLATIIGIPVAVYSIIAAHRFSAYADMTNIELCQKKKTVTGWIIFGAVLYCPFGLIGLLVLPDISNNVSVENVAQNAEPSTNAGEQTVTEVEIHEPTTQSEKEEKIEKLKRFKYNGLITEDEYNSAIKSIKTEKDD